MDLTIIVPTRDRGERILPTVESILHMNGSEHELIIIDQSTTDETARVLRSAGWFSDPRLIYQQSDTRGAARARNEGIRQSTGTIIAFTDDDCVVPSHWGSQLISLFQTVPDLAVVFAGVIPPEEVTDGWIPTYLPPSEGEVQLSRGIIRSLGYTANLAVSRRALDAIGPFDEYLGPGGILIGGEDTDFGYRALRLGLKVYTMTEPAVTHYGLRQGAEVSVLGARYLFGMAAMCTKHVRCGDTEMIRPMVSNFLAFAGEGSMHLLRGRRPSGYGAAKAILMGAVTSARHPVDVKRRLYGAQ